MQRTPPRVGLNLVSEDAFRAAALPLFEEGVVDALEFDVDESWGHGPDSAEHALPAWVPDVLDAYAEDDALYGHGVWLSVMSGRWTPRQERWMERLAAECARRRYQHVSEHFGWMTAGRYWRNTMVPVPYTKATVALGVDRMRRLADVARCRVGLENQAFALAPDDALRQGEFLDAILAPVDGFLLIDVHNVWTQAVNLGLDPAALLLSYPLSRARELHVSGGAWFAPARAGGAPVRMDSHDGAVPDGAWALVRLALANCPNLEVAFFERRGQSLDRPEDGAELRWDFRRLRAEVAAAFPTVTEPEGAPAPEVRP